MEGRNERQAVFIFINEAGTQRDRDGNFALSHQREVQDKLRSGWQGQLRRSVPLVATFCWPVLPTQRSQFAVDWINTLYSRPPLLKQAGLLRTTTSERQGTQPWAALLTSWETLEKHSVHLLTCKLGLYITCLTGSSWGWNGARYGKNPAY